MTRLFGGVLLMVAVSSCLLPGAPEPGGACTFGCGAPIAPRPAWAGESGGVTVNDSTGVEPGRLRVL